MSRDGPGLLLRDILKGDPQVEAWLKVVEAADPDVLVIGDIDYDLHAVALRMLADRLDDYPYSFTRRPNRGLDSGIDRDGDGRFGEPEDAEGYGTFAGQGGMAVLSRVPILSEAFQDFSTFPWSELPDTLALGDGRDPHRLSTTVHWDLPLKIGPNKSLNVLIWRATAPVFDGPEDRNGRRNHDEAQFWRHYIDGGFGTAPGGPFVLMGTANADPLDGESKPDALHALLAHPRLHTPSQASAGAVEAAERDGGVNTNHAGEATNDTVDWPDGPGDPGNLRVDYVMPSQDLRVLGGGVFWPPESDPLAFAVAHASRHRLVWVDVEITGKE